jgi:predicted PurR-regulated permease PerM
MSYKKDNYTMKDDEKSIKVTVSNRTVIRIIALILLAYLSVRLIIKVDQVLHLIFISIFLAIALNPAVSWIARNLKIKSRGLATSIAYLFVVGIIVGIFALIIPPLVRQTENFINNVPSTFRTLRNPNSATGRFIIHYKLNKTRDNLSQDISNHTSNIVKPVWTTAGRIGGILASVLVVFVLTFMMIVEGPSWLDRYWKLRFKKHDWHVDLASRMYKMITGYVNGQLLLAVLAGLVTLVSLIIVNNLLHTSVNDLTLAGIMLVTGLIPMFGHIIGTVIVVIACLFVSWPLAIIMGLILFIYLEIASVTIQPYVQSKYNDISPLLVLIAALLGISAGGILGAIIAIPLAGCLKIAFKEYLLHRKIID